MCNASNPEKEMELLQALANSMNASAHGRHRSASASRDRPVILVNALTRQLVKGLAQSTISSQRDESMSRHGSGSSGSAAAKVEWFWRASSCRD
jgi:hypothetical protein